MFKNFLYIFEEKIIKNEKLIVLKMKKRCGIISS